MKKKIVKIAIPFLFILMIILLGNKVQAASLEKTSVDLYVIDSDQKEAYKIDIPSNLLKTYQIKVNGTNETPKYTVTEGTSYIKVSNTGLIEPATSNVYNISTGTSSNRYITGTSKINVILSNQTLQLTVNVKSYPEYYAQKQAEKWVKENITSSMTNYEKLDKITAHVAHDYGYSYKYSSWVSMILAEEGDCWASTSTIIKLCDLVGIKAKARPASRDSGAGSGHENAVALIDGVVYECEAGYYEDKPRYYYVRKKDPPYTYYIGSDNNVTITQYDGFDENVVVPSTINGHTVTTIGDSAFTYAVTRPKKVTLPNTITTIKNSAFGGCGGISVNIPSSVTTIDGAPFPSCGNATIDLSKNKNFIIENNVLYSKDKTQLIEVLDTYNSESFTVPSTVKTIGNNAFYWNDTIKNVVLPNGVETIGKEAFYYSKITGITIPSTVKSIGKNAFGLAYSLTSVIIENGITTLPEGLFIRCSKLQTIQIPKSVTSIGKDALASTSSNLKIYGTSGSYAQTYAKDNSITFVAGTANEIIKDMITIQNGETIRYTGKLIKPKVTINFAGKNLTQGTDFTVTYDNNSINVGTYNVTVKGKGNYKGEVSVSYNIRNAVTEFDFTCSNTYVGTALKPVVTKNNTPYEPRFYYNKVGESYYTSVAPSEIGEYIVRGYISGNNYEYKSVEKKVKITKSDLPFVDIGMNNWFHDPVKYVYQKRLMTGLDSTHFGPYKELSRGMLVTILWRMEGEPKTSLNKFSDVKSGDWYFTAVNWAASKGIVHGYNTGKFGPKDNITREQLAAILMNYAKYKGKNVSARANTSKFTDFNKTSSVFKDAVSWCIANKIISGKENGTKIDPKGTATRAEAASMIMKYCLNVK